MDMSCALCDAEGRLIAQGLTLPAPPRVRARRDGRRSSAKFAGEDPTRATCSSLNDPYRGRDAPARLLHRSSRSSRRRRELVGWSASIGHQTDVGGKTPGGNGCGRDRDLPGGAAHPAGQASTSAGEPAEAVFELHRQRTCGCRSQVLGDVRAQVAACLTGERGYLALVERHGARGAARPAPTRSSTRRSGSRGTRSRRCPTAVYTLHRPHRRRRHRPGPDPDRGDDHGRRRPPGRGLRPARRRR